MEHPTEMVKEHPLPSMLLMFGLGMGVGVVVAKRCAAASGRGTADDDREGAEAGLRRD